MTMIITMCDDDTQRAAIATLPLTMHARTRISGGYIHTLTFILVWHTHVYNCTNDIIGMIAVAIPKLTIQNQIPPQREN